MRILYIAFENPALYTILNGMHDDELWGLPAFYYPFKILAERGNIIDILLISNRDFDVVPSKHFNASNLHVLKIKHHEFLGKMELPLCMVHQVRKILKEKHYDFVYGMGEGAYPGVAVAYKMGVPSALRQYGTQEMANLLEGIPNRAARRIRALKDYPYITISMNGKMSFLLTTNDGSRADELYGILGIDKKKHSFYFWRSGVAIPTTQPSRIISGERYPAEYSSMRLSHIGRISAIKRQDRSVRILGELHKRGYPFHLHLVGYPTDATMLKDIMKVAKYYGVAEYVHVEGNQPQAICRMFARNSFATLLTSDLNLGNTFYEVMSEGSLLLTNDNHSLDDFIEKDKNCLVYEPRDEAQAAEKLIALMNDPERVASIRAAAYQTAKNRFLSIEKRFQLEVDLIEDTAVGRDTSKYPKEI